MFHPCGLSHGGDHETARPASDDSLSLDLYGIIEHRHPGAESAHLDVEVKSRKARTGSKEGRPGCAGQGLPVPGTTNVRCSAADEMNTEMLF